MVMEEMRVEVVELRGSGGLGVFLRVGSDQRLYRVAPVRDPQQPRFWCLAAFECSSCGIPVSGSAIWAGAWGSSQQDLPGLLDTIRADAGAWLAGEQCTGLREKVLTRRPPLPIPPARASRRVRTDVARGTEMDAGMETETIEHAS
jgi:hypothetical protein